MELLDDKLVSVIDKVETLIGEMAQPAADLILTVARIEAAGDALLTIFAISACVAWCYGLRWGLRAAKESDSYDPYFTLTMTAGISGGVVFISAAFSVSIWGFVGMFYPEVYLAHKLIGALF